jgi:hypothetical protein
VQKDVINAAYSANPADDLQDDRPALEQALRAAAPGDEIFLPDGTYNLLSPWSTDSTTNLRLYSGVSIRGASESGVILKSTLDYSGAFTGNGNYVIRGLGITNVCLSCVQAQNCDCKLRGRNFHPNKHACIGIKNDENRG